MTNRASTYDFSSFVVLLVEDNRPMRGLLNGMLEAFGIRNVLTASEGSEALRTLGQNTVDVIICDWVMDGLDGLDFVRLVRTDNSLQRNDIPIIMLTGNSELPHVHAARDAGATEYLAKPVSPQSLAERLIHVVENPRKFIRSPNYSGPDRRRRADPEYQGPLRRRDDKPRKKRPTAFDDE